MLRKRYNELTSSPLLYSSEGERIRMKLGSMYIERYQDSIRNMKTCKF